MPDWTILLNYGALGCAAGLSTLGYLLLRHAIREKTSSPQLILTIRLFICSNIILALVAFFVEYNDFPPPTCLAMKGTFERHNLPEAQTISCTNDKTEASGYYWVKSQVEPVFGPFGNMGVKGGYSNLECNKSLAEKTLKEAGQLKIDIDSRKADGKVRKYARKASKASSGPLTLVKDDIVKLGSDAAGEVFWVECRRMSDKHLVLFNEVAFH